MDHYRTLARVDDFLDKLFLEVGGLTSTLTLNHEEVVGEELWLYAENRRNMKTLFFDVGQSISEEGRGAFLSHNACTEAVTLYSGILAHLLQALDLPVLVQEVTLEEVQPDREIIVIVDAGEICIAYYHNLFMITATSTVTPLNHPELVPLLEEDGLYTDVTARQYGRKPGLTSVKAYPAMAYNEPEYIGERYHHHVSKIEGGNYKIGDLAMEATIRTINNAFLREWGTFDGQASFSRDDKVAYAEGVKRLIKAVCRDVWRLHSELDAIIGLDVDSIELRQRYQDVTCRCAGAGHSTIIAALTQASNKPLEHFQCL